MTHNVRFSASLTATEIVYESSFVEKNEVFLVNIVKLVSLKKNVAVDILENRFVYKFLINVLSIIQSWK